MKPTPAKATPSSSSAARLVPPTTRDDLREWVDQIARLTTPDQVHWCDGSLGERQDLIDELVAATTLIPLDGELRPNSFLARSHPDDIAALRAAEAEGEHLAPRRVAYRPPLPASEREVPWQPRARGGTRDQRGGRARRPGGPR
jgi:hypothetical protein